MILNNDTKINGITIKDSINLSTHFNFYCINIQLDCHSQFLNTPVVTNEKDI